MKKLIHKYLSENYHILDGRGIFRNQEFSISLYPNILVSELNTVFGLTKKEFKWYIKSWTKKQDKCFNFNKWWVSKSLWDSIAMPLVRRVFPSTLGEDIVSVQPLTEPSGVLQFIDFQYDANLLEEPFEPRRNVAERYSRVRLNEDAYESIRLNINVDDESRDAVLAQTLNDWRNLINEQI